MIERRGFIGGLIAALAAPAIIRTPGLLMPVRSFDPIVGPIYPNGPYKTFSDELAMVTRAALVPSLFVQIMEAARPYHAPAYRTLPRQALPDPTQPRHTMPLLTQPHQTLP